MREQLSEEELLGRVQSLLSFLNVTPSDCADTITLIKMEAEYLLEQFHEYRVSKLGN